MNKIIIYLLSFPLTASTAFGQIQNENADGAFDKIVRKFEGSLNRYPLSGQKKDSVSLSSLYKTKEFNVSISKNPISFDTVHLVLKNPYYTDDFEDYKDNYINYPVSYSVIYDQKLISLFRNGKFVCHDLTNLKRDVGFEGKLNVKKFKYHWIVNGELTARSSNNIYVWRDNKWVKSTPQFPLKKQPKLFEDSEFVVFGDCHGEWGGTVYFFDKVSGETYFTESTCANSVIKKDGKYLVLASLGHMMGSCEIKSIRDPRRLAKANKNEINKPKDGQALGYVDNSEAYQKLLDFYGIQLFSTFSVSERQFYLVHLNELTFLAEIKGQEVQIVSPFFNNEIYTHNPITNSYGKFILINMDFYGTALDKEVSVIIVTDNAITKLDWNENQNR